MESQRVFAFVAFVIGCAVVADAESACSSKSCTLVGCNSGAEIDAHLTTAIDQLVGATFVLCKNGICSSGAYGSAEGGPAPSSNDVTLSGDLYLQGVTLSSESGGTLAAFQFADLSDTTGLDANVSATAVHSSDTYRVSVISSSGATLLDATRTTSYPTTLQPNGPDCDPTCHRATISVSQ